MSIIMGMYLSQFVDPRTRKIDWKEVESFERRERDDLLDQEEEDARRAE